jgi:hypothetical protein
MKKLGKDLPDVAIRTFQNLWPEEKVPDRVEVIAARLNESGARLTRWRCSSACSGADTALKFVCSWYESLDLDALGTLRSGAPTLTDPMLQERRQQRAYIIAQYAPISKFIPAPPDVEDDESEEEESETEGSQSGDSEEVVDEDIEADEPPSKTSKPVDPTPLPRAVLWKALHPESLMSVPLEPCFTYLKKLIRQMPGMSGGSVI